MLFYDFFPNAGKLTRNKTVSPWSRYMHLSKSNPSNTNELHISKISINNNQKATKKLNLTGIKFYNIKQKKTVKPNSTKVIQSTDTSRKFISPKHKTSSLIYQKKLRLFSPDFLDFPSRKEKTNFQLYNKNKIKKSKSYIEYSGTKKNNFDTFYDSNKNIAILLNSPIKINKKFVKNPKKFNNLQNADEYLQNFENSGYKKFFGKKLQWNYLQYYKRFLFGSNTPNSIIKRKILNEEKNSSNEKGIDSIYETIELNGKETKIMTKLNCKEISKSNKKEDYHKLMKNPFSSNLFGYKFIRKKKIDISRQSLNNRNLIGKIHHLIINPNTKEFRNEYLLQPQKIFVTPKNLKSNRDYKSLSKGGIERLRKIRNIKYRSEIKINSEKVGELKKKIDKLMEKNKKKFIEQKKEVENEED